MSINIIFDADDTLWETEYLYDEARERAVKVIAGEGLDVSVEIDKLAREIDKKNFEILRFSKERFPKSLVDTYKELCKKREVSPKKAVTQEIEAIGRTVFQSSARQIEGVTTTLRALKSQGCNLILWTQGDADIQNKRIEESNIKKIFEDRIEITDSKSPETLEILLKKYNITYNDTWLVGNSIRSDINPALKKHLHAIWIPNHVWDREHEALEIPPSYGELAYQADKISEVPKIIARVENAEDVKHQTDSKNSVVYLFVSAYQDLYRQYILDILAYPRGFVFRFPYDSRWLPSPYRDDPTKINKFVELLSNKNTLVVFVDERTEGEPRREQRFFPIRAGKINERASFDGGMLYIEFILGDYVTYDALNSVSKYNEEIKSLAARPRYNIEDCAYISIGPNYIDRISTQENPEHDNDAWKSTIEKLGLLNSIPRGGQNKFIPVPVDPFEKAMFFRIVGLKEMPSEHEVTLTTFLNNESGYEIDNSKNYRLELLFYFPKRPHSLVRRSKVTAKIDSEFVNGIGKLDIPLNFRYDRRHIDFLTDRVFTDIWSSISLFSTSNTMSEVKENDRIVTPEPVLLIKIKATKWVNIIAPILFALFTMLNSNVLVVKLVSVISPQSAQAADGISTIAAIIGSIGSTLLLFYLYRTLK